MTIQEKEFTIKTHDGTDMRVFTASPEDGGDHPAVLVIMEIWGLTPFIRDVCRRLAEQGYETLAPHLYSRKDQVDVFTEENIMDAMRPFWGLPPEKRGDETAIQEILSKASDASKQIVDRIMFNRKDAERDMVKDLEAAYGYLFKGKSEENRGVVGFCLGGGLAFQLSTQVPFSASVIFYGANPRNIDDLANIKGSVLGLYAGEDGSINNGLPELLENVVKHKTDFEMKIYPGTYHAFFNHTSMSYSKEASDEAWKRVSEFYASHLGE